MNYIINRFNKDELNHHGIKDMHWGIRRFQNEDGTLTEAGKRRYARDLRNANKQKASGKAVKDNPNLIDPEAWAKEDNQNLRSAVDDTRNAWNSAREIVRKANSSKKNEPLDLSNMTNKELQDAIQRANLERQYNDIYNKPEVSKGAKYTEAFFDYAVPALGVVSSALGIALAVKQIKG